MAVLTAWGVEIPLKDGIIRNTVDYVGQTRNTWMGGVRGHRLGVRNCWQATTCAMPCEDAMFWRMVFSGQGTSIPFGETANDVFTGGTRGPDLLTGSWAMSILNAEPPPGFIALFAATAQPGGLIYRCLFSTDQYTLIYNNNGTYGAHWGENTTVLGTTGAATPTNIFFPSSQQLTIVGGQTVADLLWFPMVVPQHIVEDIVAYGNAGNAISGFEKIPMSGDHFKNKLTWQSPYPNAVRMKPIDGINELYEVRIKFAEYQV